MATSDCFPVFNHRNSRFQLFHSTCFLNKKCIHTNNGMCIQKQIYQQQTYTIPKQCSFFVYANAWPKNAKKGTGVLAHSASPKTGEVREVTQRLLFIGSESKKDNPLFENVAVFCSVMVINTQFT